MKYYLLLGLLLMSGAHLDAANTAYQVSPSQPVKAKALIPCRAFQGYEPNYYFTEEQAKVTDAQNSPTKIERHMIVHIPLKYVNDCKRIYFPEENSRDAQKYEHKTKCRSWWQGLSLGSMLVGWGAGMAAIANYKPAVNMVIRLGDDSTVYYKPASLGLASLALGITLFYTGLFGLYCLNDSDQTREARKFEIIRTPKNPLQQNTGLYLKSKTPLSYKPQHSGSNLFSAIATQVKVMPVYN